MTSRLASITHEQGANAANQTASSQRRQFPDGEAHPQCVATRKYASDDEGCQCDHAEPRQGCASSSIVAVSSVLEEQDSGRPCDDGKHTHQERGCRSPVCGSGARLVSEGSSTHAECQRQMAPERNVRQQTQNGQDESSGRGAAWRGSRSSNHDAPPPQPRLLLRERECRRRRRALRGQREGTGYRIQGRQQR